MTDHAAIEQAAFRLFEEYGFEATTVDDIADAARISRRTLFRYYPSKNDIPWGQFDQTLREFRTLLDDMPPELPLHAAVIQAVVRFNDFPDEAQLSHRKRMALILRTPELQAHSALRYADWRRVIAEYVAGRLDLDPSDLLPETVSQVALALALAAYNVWLADPEARLDRLLLDSMASLRQFLQ